MLRGVSASPGFALGRVFILRTEGGCATEARARGCAEEELARLDAAFPAAVAAVVEAEREARGLLGEARAEIFAAHRALLNDPELRGMAEEAVRSGLSAEAAVDAAFGEAAAALEAEGGVFGARAADLRDLASRVKAALGGGGFDPWKGLPEDAVVLADDLLPSETLRMDRSKVAAILTRRGSSGSHSSIIARSMEIPAVVGLGELADGIVPGLRVAVDGGEGIAVLEPGAEEEEHYRRLWAERAGALAEAKRFAILPTRTADGQALALEANIGGPAEVEAALAAGAEGVGLFRTEFMFMGREAAPGEEEQYAAYRHVIERMGGRRVVIRTLDAGGDKPLAGIGGRAEENPFLGQRAIRLCLANEGLFRTQLRALLRASAHGDLGIMIPMVAVLAELRAVRRIVEEERSALAAAGAAVGRPAVGVMIEVPAAALDAERLAAEADFFSLGTNDLVQYLMAADRMNPAVAELNSGPHPVVLRLVAAVVRAAAARGKPASVCGEMAADPLAAPILAGLGVRELSMSPASIPATRAALSRLDSRRLASLARRALEAEDAEQVRRLAREELGGR